MDPEAFGRLYDAHVAQVYRYLYFRTHHRETAEDLTSQAFLKALDRLATFDPKRGSFLAWIYRIARNVLIDQYRAFRPTSDIEDIWDLRSDDDPVRDAEVREGMEKLRPCLQALPAEQRELILLRFWDGLSHAEIAAITGRSEAAAKMAFSRAMARLRRNAPPAVFLLLLLFPHVCPWKN